MHAWSLWGTMKRSLPRDAAPRPDGERLTYQVVHGRPLPAVVFFGVYLAIYTPQGRVRTWQWLAAQCAQSLE